MSSELERMATLAEKSEEIVLKVMRRILVMHQDFAPYAGVAESILKLGLSKVAPIKRAHALQAVYEELKPYCEPKFKEGK